MESNYMLPSGKLKRGEIIDELLKELSEFAMKNLSKIYGIFDKN